MGGADQAIGPDVVAEFDTALSERGIEHEIVTYEGAPHSFFDRKQEEFAEAAQDAWRRVLAFVEHYSA
jgi:carboxymethylenebutenolidase